MAQLPARPATDPEGVLADAATAAGARGAKLAGGGLGGCVLALADDDHGVDFGDGVGRGFGRRLLRQGGSGNERRQDGGKQRHHAIGGGKTGRHE